ncbi:hypothetical protein J2W91_001565 [Paenibacillus amylolyticus]|uniref:Uncharacterized protein n=1 Tax=Paenibacillus amylolyticus TaxID=1451 RepID=A0AAP5GYR7_PAEAM|nr:hypothetical protein [Paenibacillus amylolyticus]
MVNVTRYSGKAEEEANDPEPGDLPYMCHQTLRGKEWCTNNQETGGQTVCLVGLLFGVFNNWTMLCIHVLWLFS